jgi:transcriptional regulator with XRE-family HTH domain
MKILWIFCPVSGSLGPVKLALQQVLAGMPERRPELVVRGRGDDQMVVVGAGRAVLFGPYHRDDLGMRNIGMVTLTQVGFPVNEVAEAFGLMPGTLSGVRTSFRRGGAAGVVHKSGRRAILTEDKVAEALVLSESGSWTQQQLAARYGVTQSAISHALRRHRSATAATTTTAAAGWIQQELDVTGAGTAGGTEGGGGDAAAGSADGEVPAARTAGTETATGEAEPDTAAAAGGDTHGGDTGDGPLPATDDTDGAVVDAGGGSDVAATAGPNTAEPAVAARIESGEYTCRYAGVMLAHAYLHRLGVPGLFTGLVGAPWRRFDHAQIATFTVLALLLGVGSVEQVKTLVRTQAGPLIGAATSPELHTLRPRLAAIADAIDVAGLQRQLAAAMLAVAGQSAGVFYVDDHFVPYSGAKPVAMGHNGKRDRCEKGRADTLITDARGRAVCFVSGEPSHLAKTMQPALTELRAIIPTAPILLGFDRGGAYAEAFHACRAADIDFLTYRRGKLAPITATPVRHTVRRGRHTTIVILADEQIRFSDDYTGPCRQLTLYEHDTTCPCPHPLDCDRHTAVLQILTSDLTASAPDLLLALKGRWIIENTFKYLDFYGIDWLVDYHAEIVANTKLIDNPARKQANTNIRAAKTDLADAQRALGELLNTPTTTATTKNQQIPPAQQKITDCEHNIRRLTTDRNNIPVRLPANTINPDAQRALQHTHRRALLMVLRLLAYNTDTWLADHLNIYLQDPNEYRAITRSLMHQGGLITYTPHTITVTLDHHQSPRINRALTNLIEELNTNPAHIPGDPRPITYQLATN